MNVPARIPSWENIEESIRDYGAAGRLQQKQELDRRTAGFRSVYGAYVAQNPDTTEEEIWEERQGDVPYWMNPWALADLPLYLIGAPRDSEAEKLANNTSEDVRRNRAKTSETGARPLPFRFNYTALGWPTDQGKAERFVTPEEHQAILARLKGNSLTKPGSPVPIRTQSLASLLAEDLKTPGWIIEGLLREGGAMMVYGPTGVGKTLFVHTLMLMAAHGRGVGIQDDRGEWVLRAGEHKGVKVGLIDGEMTRADVSDRAKLLCKALGLTPGGAKKDTRPVHPVQLRLAMEKAGDTPEDIALWTQKAQAEWDAYTALDEALGLPKGDGQDDNVINLENINVVFKQAQDVKTPFVDLLDPEWKHYVLSYCRAEGLRVLILDNLSTLSPSLEDENSAAQWAPLNDLVVALKQAGVATILVHHSKKNTGEGTKSSFRGSSALETVLEQSVQLEAVKGAPVGQAQFKAKLNKNRVAGTPAIEGKEFSFRNGVWQATTDLAEETKAVVEQLRTLKFIGQRELAAAIRKSQPWVSRQLKTAVTLGLLKDNEQGELLAKAKALRDSQNEAAFDEDLEETEEVLDI